MSAFGVSHNYPRSRPPGALWKPAVTCFGRDDRRGFKHLSGLAVVRSLRAIDQMTPVRPASQAWTI